MIQPTAGPSAVLSPSLRAASRPAGRAGTGSVALTYGTFDLFHVGHVRLFERIRRRYDRLIVAVSTDEFNAGKGKQAVVPFADRVAVVQACRWVDAVIAETCWDQKSADVVAHGVDAFVMGDDWQGRFDFLKPLCDVVYLPRTEGVSSSLLKQQVVGSPTACRP